MLTSPGTGGPWQTLINCCRVVFDFGARVSCQALVVCFSHRFCNIEKRTSPRFHRSENIEQASAAALDRCVRFGNTDGECSCLSRWTPQNCWVLTPSQSIRASLDLSQKTYQSSTVPGRLMAMRKATSYIAFIVVDLLSISLL